MQNLAVIPYESGLKYFPSWFQQVEMESNGKSFDASGKDLELPASPLVFGEIGTEAQHSFFQLIHQGIEKIPVEFLVPLKGKNFFSENKKEPEPHSRLVINAIAQAEALITGKRTHKDKYRKKQNIVNGPEKFDTYLRDCSRDIIENCKLVSPKTELYPKTTWQKLQREYPENFELYKTYGNEEGILSLEEIKEINNFMEKIK